MSAYNTVEYKNLEANQEAMKRWQEDMTAYQQLTEKEGKVVPVKPEPIKGHETKKKIVRN